MTGWKSKLGEYSQVILNPLFRHELDLSGTDHVTFVPSFYFQGFHPDLTYVRCDGVPVKSPMDDYHSVIIAVAFRKGLTESEARRLFVGDVYERLGYFSMWDAAKQEFIQNFDAYGLNVRSEFSGWMRRGGFMHSVNHPKIDAIYDVAAKVAKMLKGDDYIQSAFRPHDNLAVAPVFPVYPEIAERYGLDCGSYLFKSFPYKFFGLDEFIAGSYEAYRKFPVDGLEIQSLYYERAMNLISEQI
ncbi:hypothetical protein EVC45_25060 [Paraburkholderia sp. UYCP14C]|nr:hypothetical protein EVC45_25060 [Paraburkholderia sp. UYCP14C]